MSQTPPTLHNAVRPVVRPSRDEDVPAIAAIYAWNVAHGTGTFETEPPDAAEMGRRRAEVLGRGLPWLVVEADLGDGPVVTDVVREIRVSSSAAGLTVQPLVGLWDESGDLDLYRLIAAGSRATRDLGVE